MTPIRVVITDDHPLAVGGIRSMLHTSSRIQVTDTYASGAALLEGLARRQPDILLLDILLPDISGKELATTVSQTFPAVKIIALTSLDAPAMIRGMMRKGCLGYLLKDTTEQILIEAIETVYKGVEYIQPTLKEQLLTQMLKFGGVQGNNLAELTQREKEVLRLIIGEYTTQEISDKLFISFRTVENHRYSLLHKLGVKNTAGLVREALVRGLTDEK